MVIQVIKVFFVQFCVFLPLLNLFCFCLVLAISVLYCAHLFTKLFLSYFQCSWRVSSLSHSIVFLYFFALFIEEGLLISPCYSLELCIQLNVTFPFLPCLPLLFFPQLLRSKTSSDNNFTFLPFFLGGGFWSLPPVQCYEPLSMDFQALCCI